MLHQDLKLGFIRLTLTVMMTYKNEISNLILNATALRIAFSTVERLLCFDLFHFPSYAFALLIKGPSCIICISVANIALRTYACFTLKQVLLWWFFLFYVLVYKIFLCCWRLMYVFIFLVELG